MTRVYEGNPEESTLQILNLIESTACIENYISAKERKWIRTECYYGNLRLSYIGSSKQLKSIVNRNVRAGILRLRNTQFGCIVVMTELGKTITGIEPEVE